MENGYKKQLVFIAIVPVLFLGVLVVNIISQNRSIQKNVIILQDKIDGLGLSDTSLLGGLTRISVGTQTRWTTDLIPSASFTVDLGSSTYPVDGIFANNASLSLNLDAINAKFSGYASASVFWLPTTGGALLGDCDTATTSKLLWDLTTGRFTCGTDANTTYTGGTDITLNGTAFDLDSTLTQAYTFNNAGSQSFSGSIDVTKGLHALAGFTVTGSASFNGGLAGSGLADCDAATKVLRWDITGGKFSCGTLDQSSDLNLTAGTDLTLTDDDLSLDSTLTQAFTFNNAGSQSMTGSLAVSKGMTANSWQGGGLQTCNATTGKLVYSAGQFSCGTDQGGGAFDATTVDAVTWSDGANASNLWTFDLSGVDPTMNIIDSGFSFGGNASISLNLEVVGVASASFFNGTAFSGVGNCTGNGKVLRWNAGVFTCGTLADADIPDNITIDLAATATALAADPADCATSTHFAVGITAGGVATCEAIADADVPDNLTLGTITGTIDAGGATSFEIPNAAAPTVDATGEIAWGTSSNSLDVFDGAVTRVNPSEKCFTYAYKAPTAATQWPGKRFLDPFTLTKISPVASGSNAVGWDLYYGPPNTAFGSLTRVFPDGHSASSSASPTYKSTGVGAFTNYTLLDGHQLDLVIASSSAKIGQLNINICGYYNH